MFTIYRKTATIYEINGNQFTRDIGLSAAEFSAEQERPGDTEENERIWTRSRLRGFKFIPNEYPPHRWPAPVPRRKVVDREKIVKIASVQLKAWRCRKEAGNGWGPENGGTIENALMTRCEISN